MTLTHFMSVYEHIELSLFIHSTNKETHDRKQYANIKILRIICQRGGKSLNTQKVFFYYGEKHICWQTTKNENLLLPRNFHIHMIAR